MCPWANLDPLRPPFLLAGAYPKVKCQVCGIGGLTSDRDDRAGYFEGDLFFGPLAVDSAMSEEPIKEYRIYVVDRLRRRLGDAVAAVARSRDRPAECCMKDAYTATVSMPLPADFHALMVVPVTVNGVELPVGEVSTQITDRGIAGPYVLDGRPLTELALALTFPEPVQGGSGSLKVRLGLSDKVSVPCRSGMDFVTNHAIVPVRAALDSEATYSVQAPDECFVRPDGRKVRPVALVQGHGFKTIRLGADVFTHDFAGPASLGPNLLSPEDGAWVTGNVSLVVYFDEAVRRGPTPVHILQRSAVAAHARVYDTHVGMAFDEFLPGKVVFSPSLPFRAGHEYELAFPPGAFQDLAGNFVSDSRSVLNLRHGYRVRVAAEGSDPLAFARYPLPGASSGVSRHTALVLEFGAHVQSGFGHVDLCFGWSTTDVCSSRESIPPNRRFFLGKKVLLKPLRALLPGQQYNVSIAGTAIRHFTGVMANNSGFWPYTFTVDDFGLPDTAAPLLIAGHADCNGDGDLDDSCDTGGDARGDFVEQIDKIEADVPLPTSTKVRMYFQEEVVAAPWANATLMADEEEGAAPGFVPVSVDDTTGGCVAVLSPPLLPGRLYSLRVPSDILHDRADQPNYFEGASFHFYTPHEPPTAQLAAPGFADISKDTMIRILFSSPTRLGFHTDKYVSIHDETEGREHRLWAHDPDRLLFRANEVIVIPHPPLLAGRNYKVTLPKHTVRYMTKDFSFAFSTRTEDTVGPSVVFTHPKGTLSLRELHVSPPGVLFSEGVRANASKRIRVLEDGVLRYTMAAADDTCGTGSGPEDACAVLDPDGRKLLLYPTGLDPDGAGAAEWADFGRSYTVEIEAGAFTDARTVGMTLANPMGPASFSFFTSNETDPPAPTMPPPPDNDTNSSGDDNSSGALDGEGSLDASSSTGVAPPPRRNATRNSTRNATAPKELDLVPPEVDYVSTPKSSSGVVVLVFSEAVRFLVNVTEVEVVEVANSTAVSAEARIRGNRVTVRMDWQPGATYSLERVPASFEDNAGNAAQASLLTLPLFTISLDTSGPVASLRPGSGPDGAMHLHEAFLLEFDEEASPREGKVTISQHSPDLTCGGACEPRVATLIEADVAKLGVRHVAMRGGKRKSLVHIDPQQPLLPGLRYSLRISEGAFADALGHPSGEANLSARTTLQKDAMPPRVVFAGVGGAGSDVPSSAASIGSHLVLGFSEAVQVMPSYAAGVRLQPSTGGRRCGRGGECRAGELCSEECGYDPASAEVQVPDALLHVNGSRVVARGFHPLELGRGYKVVIDAGKFADMAGNTMAAVDGDSYEAALVFQTSTGDNNTIGPSLLSTKPADGATLVPQTTTVRLTFDEDVHPGSGYLELVSVLAGGEEIDDRVMMPARSCYFAGPNMTCTPPGPLKRSTTYFLRFLPDVVADADGNAVPEAFGFGVNESSVSFTTIGLDLLSPVLQRVSCGSDVLAPMERREQSPRFVPQGAVLTLSFSETVQAGEGHIVLSRRSPEGLPARMDVQASPDLIFDGDSVHVVTRHLVPGGVYTLRFEGRELFVDDVGLAADIPMEEVEFRVLADDPSPPVLFQQVPFNTTIEASLGVSSNITLYFSKVVQAVPGSEVVILDGDQVISIPVNNSAPLQGSIEIHGSIVTIDPWEDLNYSSNVSVLITNGTFMDMAGQAFEGLGSGAYVFRTPDLDFELVQGHNEWSPKQPSPREGPVLEWINSTFFLFGGKAGSKCHIDSWTWQPGGRWRQVLGVRSLSHTRAVPQAANAPTAVDRRGCLWLLGGECNTDIGTLWKTCDIGSSWAPVPPPIVAPFGVEVPPPFPRSWMGHAIVVLGGWQLLIVDSARRRTGAIWRFVDADAHHVQRVAVGPLPFGVRKDPRLLAASDGTLYLLGGHLCHGRELCGEVFTDVWASLNGGETWACQTTSYAPSLWSASSRGIGRFSSAVMTHDDTIFLLGGHRPNSTEGLNEVYSSYAGTLDADFEGGLYASTPSQALVPVWSNLSLHFSEGIVVDARGVRLLDYGRTEEEGHRSMPVEVNASVMVRRQTLIVSADGGLSPGHRYRVRLAKGTVKDLAGHPLKRMPEEQQFLVDPDQTVPVVLSMFPPNGSTGVAPYTTLTLNMSEPVRRGSGSLVLAAEAWGRMVGIDIEDAVIHRNMVFFRLPGGVRLTCGQTYHVSFPSGLLLDAAGHELEGATVGSFTVLSGFYPSFDYSRLDSDREVFRAFQAAPRLPEEARVGIWHNLTLELVEQGDNETSILAVLNTTQLELLAVYPPPGATDIPAVQGVSVLMFFSRPVVVNNSGQILFRNASRFVVGSLDMSRNGTGNTSHVQVLPTVNGARILIPWSGNNTLLEVGHNFTVEVPRGMIQDLDGNELDAISVSFTCLAEETDNTPPVVTMHRPLLDEEVPGMTTQLDVFFSKEMEPGNFATRSEQFFVKVRHLSGSSPDSVLIVGGGPGAQGTATVLGPRLSLTLAQGALLGGGSYALEVPQGAVRSKLRILPGRRVLESVGIEYEGITVHFSAARDIDGPTLDVALQMPPNEDPPTFALPTSASILLTFSEPVQAGRGSIFLVPRHARTNLSMPASSAVIAGSKVFVSPPRDLLPGEAYSLVIDESAFEDRQGNPFRGLEHGNYTISTAARMRFRQLGRGHWGDPERGLSGQRLASGAAVSSSNDIFLFGGRNGTTGASGGSVLNDVWRLRTLREVKCASSFIEPTNCSAQECSPDGMGGHMLGRTTLSELVWKRRSAGGASCLKPGGVRMSALEHEVKGRREACPCPRCTVPPGRPPGPRLPDHMPNTTYVNSYLLVSAANGTRPLLCRPGRTPTGPFTCVARTRWFGTFVTPYPTCEESVCSAPPDVRAVRHFSGFLAAGSTDGMDCARLSASSPMPHGGSCAFTCDDGWDALGTFQCFEGAFRQPRCLPQICNGTTIPHGIVDCSTVGGPSMGSLCSVVCNPGYEPVDLHVRCTMQGVGLEARTGFEPAPACRRSSCGDYPFTIGASVAYPPNSAKKMGDTAQVTCDSEHLANGRIFNLRCGPKQGAVWSTGVEWQLTDTGVRAGLLCARSGTEVQELVVLNGRLDFDLQSPNGASLRSICGNQDFFNNIAISIALSLASISQRTVEVSDVHDLELSACGQGRRLGESTVLLYKVVVPGEGVAAQFTALLSDASATGTFERTLTEALQLSTGWTAQRVRASPLGVNLVHGTGLPPEPIGTTTTAGPSTTGDPPVGLNADFVEEDDSAMQLAIILGSAGGAICLLMCCTLFIWVRRRRRTYGTSVSPSVKDWSDSGDLALEDDQDPGRRASSMSYSFLMDSSDAQTRMR